MLTDSYTFSWMQTKELKYMIKKRIAVQRWHFHKSLALMEAHLPADSFLYANYRFSDKENTPLLV